MKKKVDMWNDVDVRQRLIHSTFNKHVGEQRWLLCGYLFAKSNQGDIIKFCTGGSTLISTSCFICVIQCLSTLMPSFLNVTGVLLTEMSRFTWKNLAFCILLLIL